jgi:type VI secretion system protein ImpE
LTPLPQSALFSLTREKSRTRGLWVGLDIENSVMKITMSKRQRGRTPASRVCIGGILRHCEGALEDRAACALAAQMCIEAMLAESLVCTKQTPQNWRPHWMAFQWACITGQWDIALTMLEQCAMLAPQFCPSIDQYRGCLRAECHRASVFHSQSACRAARPNFLSGTRRWVKRQLGLLQSGHDGGLLAAKHDYNLEADKSWNLPGTSNLGAFAWLHDGDDRLGPISEIFLGGRYFWVPFESMAEMTLTPVVCVLDRVWRPVEILLWDGTKCAGFLPARYIGSQWTDDELKLGHRTLWIWLNSSQQAGLGERQLCSEQRCWPLSQLTIVRFHPAADSLLSDERER